MRGMRGCGDVGCEIALCEARESETMTYCLVVSQSDGKNFLFYLYIFLFRNNNNNNMIDKIRCEILMQSSEIVHFSPPLSSVSIDFNLT